MVQGDAARRNLFSLTISIQDKWPLNQIKCQYDRNDPTCPKRAQCRKRFVDGVTNVLHRVAILICETSPNIQPSKERTTSLIITVSIDLTTLSMSASELGSSYYDGLGFSVIPPQRPNCHWHGSSRNWAMVIRYRYTVKQITDFVNYESLDCLLG